MHMMQPPMSARITSFASLQLGVAPWFILQPLSRNGWLDDQNHVHGLCKFYMFAIPKLRTPMAVWSTFWTSQLRPSLDSAKGIVARRNLPPSGKKLDISWANHAVVATLTTERSMDSESPCAVWADDTWREYNQTKHGMKFECSLPHTNFECVPICCDDP